MCGVRWGAFSKELRDKQSDLMMSVVLTVTGSATAGTADATGLLGVTALMHTACGQSTFVASSDGFKIVRAARNAFRARG